MDHQGQSKNARSFAIAFATALAESLTRTLGVSWLVKLAEDSDATKSPQPGIHFRLAATGGLRGDCFATLDQGQVVALGSRLLGQPPSDFSDQQGEAVAAVILSAMEGLSSALADQFGVVNLKVDRVEDVRLEEMLAVPLAASGEDQVEVPLLLYFNKQLLGALSSSIGDRKSATAKKTMIDPANLQLVMDVELNVSLRFGQCQLPLRDVLDLASGSVIELDRDVDDPVELLLDGKVIARGEAVIVDGNYGLRITEIPEPMTSHFGR
ncbi:MAG: flagellar motor switch protein FliN [Acidobacteriota bacterium]|nr:flagellar motor switch protein FliN [Acidobacteriota bacterium]